ncbi:hypothetical protein TcWFU_005421 [Taenia crassiceps]|uniref:Uncharacterized protein n=1 Tax=Taenia crassiceps TaxID=6207 RepID=A0ABR4QGS2_9CEST
MVTHLLMMNAEIESERDNALTELSRLRSVLHILHGKDYRVLGNVPSQRTCSSHITNRPAISSKMMSFPSKGCSMNRRSLSMSTSSHNSGDRLHQNVVTVNRMDSMTNNLKRSLLRGGHPCGSSHSLPTSRSRECCQRPHVSSVSPRKRSRSCSLFSSESRRFDPTAYIYGQRRKHQEVKQKRKLEETSRLSRQSPSPIFPNRLRFPAANCAVISGRESTASTLQQRRLPLWKPNLNKSSTAVASRRWDRLISGESNSSGLSDCNLQRACRLSEKRDTVHQLSRLDQTRIPLPSDDTYLNRELCEMSRRLDDLQGYLGDYFSHLPL